MYRMLIIDNEEIIVEGLVELFSEQPELELEVFGAYSADEAILLLERTKFDIVLTDIHMPGMSGLQLQQVIIRQWPWCKVIFLTGFSRFEYAQSALRNEGIDFVLKTEGDGKIIEAVQKAKAKLQEQTETRHRLEQAQRQMDKALPLLRQTCLKELLDGDSAADTQADEMLREFGTGLTTLQPVLPVVGRLDDLPGSPKDRALYVCALQNRIEGYLSAMTAVCFVDYDKTRFVLLMQPLDSSREERKESEYETAIRTQRFIHGMLEHVQQESKHAWNVRLSFALADEFVRWERLPDMLSRLKGYFHFGLGIGPESMLAGPYIQEDRSGEGVATSPTGASSGNYDRLKRYLEQGRKEEFQELIRQMMPGPDSGLGRPGNEEPRRMELYYHFVALLMTAVNEWELYEAVQAAEDFRKLAVWDDTEGWEERFGRLFRLSGSLFDLREDGYRKDSDELVNRINQYIDRHINGDLSLTRLGEAMKLNPSYLSRHYKQTTGKGVSEYIMEARLSTAKRLLTGSRLKIHEISAEAGFLTDATFYRCFKKAIRLTPQEYREVNK
ncbi:response regulator [Paenibacillus mesophilus]|uniref:response regulator n=1 Tax=Paenibacillus mesophilus TaxID=2582849 RepID=UPI00110F5DFA|nr:response regulator [Paenibacillus mesophilus]TMV52774.1 response regulator [Paenibacillus mesophilus]